MPAAPAYISHRLSIRWVPEEPSEPTNTLVLTGARTGAFLDVRFFKEPPGKGKTLDWAFAGYRYINRGSRFYSRVLRHPYLCLRSYPLGRYSDTPNVVRFKHHIDSRTTDEVEDSGTNTTLPDGTTLEVGEMTNPRTGKMAPFEEVWKDEEAGETDTVVFVRNVEGTTWRARVGKWQLALGRSTDSDGKFWAWRAEDDGREGWIIRDSTESDTTHAVKFLPERGDLIGWVEGAKVKCNAEDWIVLERNKY